MKIIVLGSGTSQGIPIIGCKCKTCTSTNPKDKRLRVSVYLEIQTLRKNPFNLLIDTSPDFRQQMLANNLDDVDSILFTHAHIDHIMGLDDIRQINQLHKKEVDIYGNKPTIDQIKQSFSYIFDPNTYKGGGIPKLNVNVIDAQPFEINGINITPVIYKHGPSEVYGYRIRDFAYLTDCSSIPETEFEKLSGLKVLIIDALRFRPHPTHFSIDEALEAVKRIKPEKTYFVHMTHDIMHDEVNKTLPEGVELAFDGMVIEL